MTQPYPYHSPNISHGCVTKPLNFVQPVVNSVADLEQILSFMPNFSQKMGFNILIWVNLTYTAGYEPVFEIVYCHEIAMIFVILLSVPVAIIAVWRAVPMHANTRLIYISFLTHCFFASAARIPLIYHQAYGHFMDEYTTLVAHFSLQSVVAVFGWLAFALVYLLNHKLLGRYKCQVRLASNHYNVNRSYQIRENLVVMKHLSKLVLMTPFIYLPPFSFFTLSLIVKEPFLQCVFKALFDIAVSFFTASLIVRLLTADRRFEKGLRSITIFDELYKCRGRERESSIASITTTTVHRDEMSIHFTQLSKDWATTRF
uniref:G protein-coupled receptor n=1 Tax=Pristionchus pacificus TaxID=54126 RepID=A0A8R1YS82_PRIPA